MKRSHISSLVSLISLSFILPACAPSQPDATKPESKASSQAADEAGYCPGLLADLQAMIDAGSIPGAVVYKIKAGKVIYKTVAGYEDIEAKIPIKEDTIFRLYSMSKPLTSVAIMQLVEDGKLSLDTPLESILPAFSDMKVYVSGDLEDMVLEPAERSITISDLLTHTSGITYHFTGDTPVHQYYRKHGVMRDTPVGRTPEDGPPARNLDELMDRLGASPMLHQPGEEFAYSYSTTILGAVIEKVSGQKLNVFMQERLFGPLEMPDTGFLLTDEDKSRFVVNYMMGGDGLERIEDWENTDYRDTSRLLDGGGAIAGTAEDYLHFVQMLANRGTFDGRRILNPEAVSDMFLPHVEAAYGDSKFLFGYGFEIGTPDSEAGGRLPEGTVGWSGSGNTYFWLNPQTGDGVVFMTQVILTPAYSDLGASLRKVVMENCGTDTLKED